MKQRMYYLGQTRKHTFWLDLKAGKAYLIGLVAGYICGKMNEREHTQKVVNNTIAETLEMSRIIMRENCEHHAKLEDKNVPKTEK